MRTLVKGVQTLNPFRAGSGLFPSCLAGRVAVLNVFTDHLYATITGSPRNTIVYGNKKMGRTCLLIKMEELSFTKKLLTVSTITSPDHLKSFVENIAVRLFTEASTQMQTENGACRLVLERIQALPAQVHSAELEGVFSEFLLCLWNQIEAFVPAIFISIDDIDLVDNPAQALRFIYTVTQNVYRKNCPTIFAASCSQEFFTHMEKKHRKLIECFELMPVAKLKMSSLENAIKIPLWEREISYDEAVVKEIARLSGGFPFYLQHIAHYVFEEMNTECDTLALRRGYARAMQYLKRDIFSPREQEIPLNERKILISLFEGGPSTFSELLKRVKLPRGSVASSLRRLKEKQLIEQDEKRYCIYDRLFGDYLYKKAHELTGV